MKKIIWAVSPHAKQRACERYGVFFSPRCWKAFCTQLQNGKNLFPLAADGSRCVCFFQHQWFLFGCHVSSGKGAVTTFLPIGNLTDTEKNLLFSDSRAVAFDPHALAALGQPVRELPPAAAEWKKLPIIPLTPDDFPLDFAMSKDLLDRAAEMLSRFRFPDQPPKIR